MKWRRHPTGYLSDDGRWFLERGGRMTHGCNAWLIWREATDDDISPDAREGMEKGYSAFGHHVEAIWPLRRISGGAIDDDRLFIDMRTEGGWLSEAKDAVEVLINEEG